jgi:hypothetical protein
VSSAHLTISMTHQLYINDLSSQTREIIKFVSLEIVRMRTQLEYRYA